MFPENIIQACFQQTESYYVEEEIGNSSLQENITTLRRHKLRFKGKLRVIHNTSKGSYRSLTKILSEGIFVGHPCLALLALALASFAFACSCPFSFLLALAPLCSCLPPLPLTHLLSPYTKLLNPSKPSKLAKLAKSAKSAKLVKLGVLASVESLVQRANLFVEYDFRKRGRKSLTESYDVY